MPGTITRDILEAHLKCKYKGRLKLLLEQGEPSSYGLLMQETRERVHREATARLLARHTGQEVPRGLPLEKNLLNRGFPLILDTTLEANDLSVCFDALLRANRALSPEPSYYIPVLFHEAQQPSPELRILLAALAELLGPLQGKVPAAGLLIHGQPCRERRVQLTGVAKQARRLLREVREARDSPPRLVLNNHCQACEYRKRCQAEATATDDLSLLRGMGEGEVAKYAKRGILTVAQLASTFRPPRRRRKPDQRKRTHSHALQALAIREKKLHILGSPVLPEATRRLYLDIEGDPERSFCYLVGVIVREGEEEVRHSFWLDSPADEAKLLGQFLSLAALRPDAQVYAYGAYEANFLRRAGKAAGREEEVAQVLTRLFNVLSVIHLHVYFPLYRNGLEDIAGHLGFRWTDPEASGLQSVVWRRRWEETGDQALKEKLATYNREDCQALRCVTEFLYAICPRPEVANGAQELSAAHEVVRVEELRPLSSRREWCKIDFAVPDFVIINERAYFDYQRDRVYVRSSKALKKRQTRDRRHRGRKNLRADRSVHIGCEVCPSCGATELTTTEDRRLARICYDLQIARGGVRRRVTRCTTSWHHCGRCEKRFLPLDYLRLEEHGHGLKCWAMYKHVAYRATFEALAGEVSDCYGLPVPAPVVHSFQSALAQCYGPTYQALLSKIVSGFLVHADETEVHLRGQGKGYIWVFTNLEEVVFLYRKTREGGFLAELLKGFAGVLVTDFYAAYDSLGCPQQKCLVHLMRDLNSDIQCNPWDEELKALAAGFGRLLREIVATIDGHGLKARHLRHHQKDVNRFFGTIATVEYRSAVAEGYRERLLKYQDKLFTFLGHDGIPWNNNNAEHAVKQFAYYRETADGLLTEKGLSDYLVLLSIRLSCKYKWVNFLKFLLSRQPDIDVFAREGARRGLVPALELHPEGVVSPRVSRRQTWNRVQGQEAQGPANP